MQSVRGLEKPQKPAAIPSKLIDIFQGVVVFGFNLNLYSRTARLPVPFCQVAPHYGGPLVRVCQSAKSTNPGRMKINIKIPYFMKLNLNRKKKSRKE